MKSAGIVSDVARLRSVAEKEAGSAVMILLQKRVLMEEIVLAYDGMWGGCKIRTSNRLAAIKLDNELAGDGAEAGANDTLRKILVQLQK